MINKREVTPVLFLQKILQLKIKNEFEFCIVKIGIFSFDK